MMRTGFKVIFIGLLILGIASLPLPGSASIIGISIPENSQDGACYALNAGVWSVSAPPYPLSTLGIGHIIIGGGIFNLHDHHYVADNIPDPTRAVVTYQFDVPTIVKGLEIVQHGNGIGQIEGSYGNSLDTLSSLGTVSGPGISYEGQDQIFDLNNTTHAGTYFQFIVRRTTNATGFASYNDFPLDVNDNRIPGATELVPLPPAVWLLGSGLGLLAWKRRSR